MDSIPDLTNEVKWSQDDHRGAGSFGDIYKGNHRNGQPVAVKKLRHFLNPDEKQKKVRKRLRRELQILHKLNHPNIIKLLGTIFHKNHEIHSMVFPWMEGGDLKHYLLEKRKDASLNRRLDILLCLSKGLEYLHTHTPKPVVHGDLSAGNILFDGNGVPHLSDFGLATILDQETYQTSTVTENIRWSAPEYRSHESTGPLKATREGDVYSFGSIIFTVLSGKIPYHYHTTNQQLQKAVLIENKWPKRDHKILDLHWKLICHCWQKNDADRPQIQTVVKTIAEFCNQLEDDDETKYRSAMGDAREMGIGPTHAYPSFDPDTFTPHIMVLVDFPKGTTHMELVGFIHRQHSRDSQKDEPNPPPIKDPPSVDQQIGWCMRCPTSLFVTCRSKAYATYESDGLLQNSVIECSGKTWNELGSKIICKGYARQDGKDTLKHERGTGFFIRWKSFVPVYVPHRKRRAFLMRSRNPEFKFGLQFREAKWQTQRHNETLLNQAFNAGTEVYLVFCAREAREIFGIARMEEPIPTTAPRPSGPPPIRPESGPELGSLFRISWEGKRHITFDALLQEENSCVREGVAMIKGGRDGIELAPEFLNFLGAKGHLADD